jgi:hypothetical protein
MRPARVKQAQQRLILPAHPEPRPPDRRPDHPPVAARELLERAIVTRARPRRQHLVGHQLERHHRTPSDALTCATYQRCRRTSRTRYVALVNIAPLLAAAARHWNIDMAWDAEQLNVAVRDQRNHDGPQLEGRWPPTG